MEKRVAVKKSRNGKGIFATQNFSKHQKIFQIKGKLITCYIDDDVSDDIRNNTFRFDDELYINPEGEIGVFANHSCDPNAYLLKGRNKLYMVALRTIAEGKEILFDYSTTLDDSDVWSMQCNCGSDNCRGEILSFQTLPKETKLRYLQQKIVPAYIK